MEPAGKPAMQAWFGRILWLTLLLCGSTQAAEFFSDKQCLPKVLEVIRGTKKVLVVSVFDINQPDIVAALMEAQAAGKEIHIISDRRQAKSEYSRTLDLYLMGVDIRLNSKRRLHHNKFAISDDRVSLSGSFNWTNSAAKSNSEDLTVLRTGWLKWSETQSIADMRKKFDEDWEKNTEGKSDKYFEDILKERRTEVRDRLQPWVKKVLTESSTRDRNGRRMLESALRVISKTHMFDKDTLEMVAALAEPGSRSATDIRAAALQILGQAKTHSPDHQITILMAAADSNSKVKTAAREALDNIGNLHGDAQAYTGLGAAIWRTKIYCRSLFRIF